MTRSVLIRLIRSSGRSAVLVLLIAGIGLPGAAFAAGPDDNETGGDYALDSTHATLLWKVNHLGFSDYVGRFNSFDASLRFDPEFPSRSKLTVVIDAASLDVNNPEFAGELRGGKWFNSEKYPQIRFVSTDIKRTDERMGKVTGDLTFMGITRPVTLNVELTGEGRHIKTGTYTLGFMATGTVQRSEFGLERMVPLIGDHVTLEIHAEFTKKQPARSGTGK